MRIQIEDISEENLRKVVRANQKELYEFARRMERMEREAVKAARDFVVVYVCGGGRK